jgi:septal ring factor EnvC (AmiA/AmiB activator)
MKQVLIWKNKYDTQYWDASTPELEKKVFLTLFQAIKKEEYYFDLEDDNIKELERYITGLEKAQKAITDGVIEPQFILEKNPEQLKHYRHELSQLKEQRELFDRAVKGDPKAAKQLLTLRKNAEYEEWSLERVDTP